MCAAVLVKREERRANQASVCFHVGESKGWQCAMRPAEHEVF